MKLRQYRVELFHQDDRMIVGMRSDFSKQDSLENARRWAIERGRKGNAESVRLYVKDERKYNRYSYITEISLI
jgi:hypothetical protein